MQLNALQVHLVLVFNWFDFHLSSFSGVAVTFPVIPVYTCIGRRVLAVMIDTVAPGSRRLLKSQRSRAKQLVAMNVASGDDLLIE